MLKLTLRRADAKNPRKEIHDDKHIVYAIDDSMLSPDAHLSGCTNSTEKMTVGKAIAFIVVLVVVETLRR